jgi:histone H3/H4
MQSTALLALQEAAKYFMVDVFNDNKLSASHAKRITIMRKDMVLCVFSGLRLQVGYCNA